MSLLDALLCLAAILAPFASWGIYEIQRWFDRRRIRREIKAAGSQSFTIDVCEPGGDDTSFGTITYSDGTKIRGTL